MADPVLERALARRIRDEPVNIGASLEVWERWLDGQWSLVEQWDPEDDLSTPDAPPGTHGIFRFVVAERTPSQQRDRRRLTRQERQCAEWVALGDSSKEIAYEVGVSEAAVTAHLTCVRRKLGLRSRTELAAFFAPCGIRRRLVEFAAAKQSLLVGVYPLCQAHTLAPLTEAERAVAALLLRGASNQLIAERRCTSRHTTANQIQAIFRKLGVRSRVELATAMQTAPALRREETLAMAVVPPASEQARHVSVHRNSSFG